ncbi:CBS domain-containing protein [Actinoallomurus acaciae]|uniref:CBS domain-containing protein n=1 Tax=Actinoallomurus acaciae TaxID=502577 RepID=A0ABV5YR21_9ACTN
MARKIRDVMTPAPVSVSGQTSLSHAAGLMRAHGIGVLLILDDGRLLGMVTDRDIVVRAVADGRDVRRTTVAEICSCDLITVSPDDDADNALRSMREHLIRRLPVVEDDRPVGVLSITDLATDADVLSPASASRYGRFW